MTTVVAIAPDTVAVFRALLLARAADAGDTAPVISSRRDPGVVPPFSLVRDAGERRARNAPVLNPARVAVQVFDETDTGAARRLRRIVGLLHGFGPAIVELEDADGGSVGVFRIFDETGVSEPLQEPVTNWWVARGTFALYMTDRSVD